MLSPASLRPPGPTGSGQASGFPQIGRAALVIGHPGHELRVFGWTHRHRPIVFSLTDGSGSRGAARIDASAELIEGLGARRGSVFGDAPDADYYRAILAGDAAFFLSRTEMLARSFIDGRIDFVASDAVEGFNPVHDLCFAIASAAAVLASRARNTRVAHYAFTLSEWELGIGAPGAVLHDASCRHLLLSEELFAHKLEAAHRYGALKAEVVQALSRMGADYFRVECLREAQTFVAPMSWQPFYERFAEGRVAEGAYPAVIRYREHVAPILEAISAHAGIESGDTVAA